MRVGWWSAVCAAALAMMGCAPAPDPSEMDQERSSTFKIAMSRHACDGICPTYWIEITGDGDVTYCGVKFVHQHGEFRRRIGIKQVAKLTAAIEAAKFWDLRDFYSGRAMHKPPTVVVLEQNGRRKSVSDFSGAGAGMPVSVSILEHLIDDIGGAAEWAGEWDGERDGWHDGDLLDYPECALKYFAPPPEPLSDEEILSDYPPL